MSQEWSRFTLHRERKDTAETPLSPELEPYAEDARKLLERYAELFYLIAQDRSIRFKVGMGFFIDLKTREITLDVKDFKRANEQGLSEDQIIWSVCHEISHLYDLKNAPAEMLANFEYLERRSAALVGRAVEAIKSAHGVVPDYLMAEIPVFSRGTHTMSILQHFLYTKLHLLYNSVDDIYVNEGIGLRTALFAGTGSKAQEVERFYRDFLFPTDPQKIGVEPREGEAMDIASCPCSHQFAYFLLRRRMVPGQKILVAPEVRSALDEYPDNASRARGITRAEFADMLTRVGSRDAKNRNPGWRYKQIRIALEPAYVDLLLKDLSDPKFPPPPASREQAQRDEAEPSSVWDELGGNPEPIDLDVIRDFIKQQEEQSEKQKKKEKEDREKRRLTPDKRLEQDQSARDRKICSEYNVDPKVAEEYRELERSVKPYKQELASVFTEIMNTINEKIQALWVGVFRSGKFDVNLFLRKYDVELAAEQHDMIPFDQLDTYLQQEFERRLVLFPNQIRVRLVLDGSGSMTPERIIALKQLAVLFLEALATFEAELNMQFHLAQPMVIDTEVSMFGSREKSVVVKERSRETMNAKQEMAARFRAFGAINNNYGESTCDAEPLWNIRGDRDEQWKNDLASGRAKEFVFVVTDGGSNEVSKFWKGGFKHEKQKKDQSDTAYIELQHVLGAQDSRNAIHALKQSGVVACGFQIGVSPDDIETITDLKEKEWRILEITTFDKIWGDAGAHILHPSELAKTVAALFAQEIKKMQLQLSYIGDESVERVSFNP